MFLLFIDIYLSTWNTIKLKLIALCSYSVFIIKKKSNKSVSSVAEETNPNERKTNNCITHN